MTLEEFAAMLRPVDFRETSRTRRLTAVLGSKLLSEITSWDVEQYRTLRRGVAVPSTINREIGTLRHILNLAQHHKFISVNPCAGLGKLREPAGRTRYLTNDEERRLFSAMDRTRCGAPWVSVAVLLALHTGLRRGELLALTWVDVDLSHGCLFVRQAKNGRARVAYLNTAAAAVLSAWQVRQAHHGRDRQAPSGVSKAEPSDSLMHVLSWRGHRPDIGKAWRGLCRRARVMGVRFHDLRHTFASRLVMADVNIRTVQELLGHRDITATMRYAHVNGAHLAGAVERLVAHNGNGHEP